MFRRVVGDGVETGARATRSSPRRRLARADGRRGRVRRGRDHGGRGRREAASARSGCRAIVAQIPFARPAPGCLSTRDRRGPSGRVGFVAARRRADDRQHWLSTNGPTPPMAIARAALLVGAAGEEDIVDARRVDRRRLRLASVRAPATARTTRARGGRPLAGGHASILVGHLRRATEIRAGLGRAFVTGQSLDGVGVAPRARGRHWPSRSPPPRPGGSSMTDTMYAPTSVPRRPRSARCRPRRPPRVTREVEDLVKACRIASPCAPYPRLSGSD
jgi:hypothetical protein